MSEIKITVGSLPDYEDLVAEIYLGDFFVGLVSQEKGRGNFQFEASAELVGAPVPLLALEEGLQSAKGRLLAIG